MIKMVRITKIEETTNRAIYRPTIQILTAEAATEAMEAVDEEAEETSVIDAEEAEVDPQTMMMGTTTKIQIMRIIATTLHPEGADTTVTTITTPISNVWAALNPLAKKKLSLPKSRIII